MHAMASKLLARLLVCGTVVFAAAAPTTNASAAGTKIAYAHVRGDGTLDTANSKNVSAMAGGNGLYCFKLLFAPKTVVATISEDPTSPSQGPGFIRAALPPTPLFTCAAIPAPSAVVATFNQTQSTGGYAFYVYWAR